MPVEARKAGIIDNAMNVFTVKGALFRLWTNVDFESGTLCSNSLMIAVKYLCEAIKAKLKSSR